MTPEIRLEAAPCPRCGTIHGRTVVEGIDHVYNVPGRFFAWECAGCGLQFQNPRPTPDCLSALYPKTYGPHGGKIPGSEVIGDELPEISTLRVGIKRLPIVSLLWPYLHAARSTIRSFRQHVSSEVPKRIRTSHPQLEPYLREKLGYSHLQFSQSARGRICGWNRHRRLAGVELIPRFVPGGRLLEIGCATGDRLQRLRNWGWTQLDGIELAQHAATQAQERGFRVVCEAVETALDRFPDASFDVIVSSMVMEHLYNPFAVAQTIARKLRPGGQFLFSTVTRDSLDARLFGPYWGGYDFPRHMVHLRLSDIGAMLVDFDILESFHQNAPQDFIRPTTWRRPEGRLSDKLISRMAKSTIGPLIGELLARLRQTCRVSLRCRRK